MFSAASYGVFLTAYTNGKYAVDRGIMEKMWAYPSSNGSVFVANDFDLPNGKPVAGVPDMGYDLGMWDVTPWNTNFRYVSHSEGAFGASPVIIVTNEGKRYWVYISRHANFTETRQGHLNSGKFWLPEKNGGGVSKVILPKKSTFD